MPDNSWFDDTDDELADDDYPDEYDDDGDPSLTVPCPECGASVYEDAVECPACGLYITHRANVWDGRPTWWIVLGLLGVVAVVLALGGLLPW